MEKQTKMEKQKILIFGITAILIVSIIFMSGCISQPTEKPPEAPPEAPPEEPAVEQPPAPPTCPASCDDGNACTKDYCSLDTNYECKNDPLTPCCGNDVCESDESYESCPEDCPPQKPEVEPKPSNETEITQDETEIKETETPAGAINAEELAIHGNKYDCWVAYEGKVYDITNWAADKTVVSLRCGSSNAFDDSIKSRYDVTEIINGGTLKGTFQEV